MKRAGALVAAVAMVAVAFVVRDSVSGDDDGGGSGGSASGLLCPTELDEICVAASTRVEAANTGAAADRLIEATDADELGAEAWIVPAAWAKLVLAERERLRMEPIFTIDGEPLASAPVTMAIWADEAEVIADRCGTELGWRCLAEQVESTTGPRITVGAPDVNSATGLPIAAAQASGILGTNDFARHDFDTLNFRTLAARLASGQTNDALSTMRTRGRGQFTAAGALMLGERSFTPRFGTIELIDVAPRVRADIVALVPAGHSLDGGIRDALADAFAEAGWDGPVDGPDGLPAGGVLAAIRTLWNER